MLMSLKVVYNSVMEIANQWTQAGEDIRGVRIGQHGDAHVITKLLREATYAHLHADWHYPVDWLGSPGFVVVDGQGGNGGRSLTDRLFGEKQDLQACLAVAADPPPAAWVRVAAVIEDATMPQILAAMFASIVDYLRQDSITQLGWLLVESWPESWIRGLGFEQDNFVETFIKKDNEFPAVQTVPGLVIRSVQDSDLQMLERIEADAFAPLWRHSKTSLTLAWRHALSFDVAELEGEVVGYQFSTPVQSGAHLARMTVDPAFQGNGVGTFLLAYACEWFRRQGIETITLNTQADNHASRKLYQRFGFRRSGQRFPVWTVDL
jgi:ribosomal protein S18 acetylase RimI-like enzyme